MPRTLVLILGIVAVALAVACGDDDGDDTTPADANMATATSETDNGDANGDSEPAPTATRVVATPTPIPFSGTAIVVASREGQYAPTLEEFRGLPTVELTLPDGRVQAGVTLETLAAKVDLGEAVVVTIEGFSPGFGAKRFVRRAIDEVASTTIVYETAGGHLALASTVLGEDEWLEGLVSIAFE